MVDKRKPFPRSGVSGGIGSVVECVAVDDHPVVSRIRRGFPKTGPAKAIKHLDQVTETHRPLEIPESLEKAVRNQENSIVIGAQIRGEDGLVSSPNVKAYELIRLTFSIVFKHSERFEVALWLDAFPYMGSLRLCPAAEINLCRRMEAEGTAWTV